MRGLLNSKRKLNNQPPGRNLTKNAFFGKGIVRIRVLGLKIAAAFKAASFLASLIFLVQVLDDFPFVNNEHVAYGGYCCVRDFHELVHFAHF